MSRIRPWYSPIRLARNAAIIGGSVYVFLCGFLYFTQDDQIYPTASEPITEKQGRQMAHLLHLVPWDAPTPGAASPQGFVAADFAGPAPRGTVVLFHGNGDTAYDREYYVEALSKRGFRTFLYEYPGYGGRPGHPREATIVPDARALIRELDAKGLGPIYVWGESLGSGVAASVVADPTLSVHGLVLMMPWDNIANVGYHRFPYVPVALLMHDKYDSVANLEHFKHPICVLRGDLDDLVPPKLTLNLFAHLPDPKLMILRSGYGHGNWPVEPTQSWWDEALDFIAPPVK